MFGFYMVFSDKYQKKEVNQPILPNKKLITLGKCYLLLGRLITETELGKSHLMASIYTS